MTNPTPNEANRIMSRDWLAGIGFIVLFAVWMLGS